MASRNLRQPATRSSGSPCTFKGVVLIFAITRTDHLSRTLARAVSSPKAVATLCGNRLSTCTEPEKCASLEDSVHTRPRACRPEQQPGLEGFPAEIPPLLQSRACRCRGHQPRCTRPGLPLENARSPPSVSRQGATHLTDPQKIFGG